MNKFKSSWLNRNLLLSFTLFTTTYALLGWSIAGHAILWADFLHEQNISLERALEDDFFLGVIRVVALLVIIVVTFLLSAPVALTTFLFEDSIHPDIKGFFSILIWSIVLVFAFCFFDYFADLLVIISANLLLKLDLQKLKYPNWQIIILTVFLASVTFLGGMTLFELLADNPTV